VSQCHDCIHRALRVIGNFAIWKCAKRGFVFGNETDWRKGVNQPDKCKDYVK